MNGATQMNGSSFLNPDFVVGELGLAEGMSVGDFGCGSGHLAVLIAQKIGVNGKLYAIDILEDKLDSVRVKAKTANVENIETVRANLEVLGSTGLANDSQDLVLLINILFQSQKKQDIFKEAHRVLKPGGRLVVIDWQKASGGFGPPDELRTSEAELYSMVEQVGFSKDRPLNVGQFHYGSLFQKV